MKTNPTRQTLALSVLFLSTLVNQPSTALAQGTAFTYQGRLNDGASPASGIYDLRFTIYDSTNNPGTLIAGPLTNSGVNISNGLFTVALDFGTGVFAGSDRWLEISARSNGGGAFTTLSPRQPISPTPYAMHAANAAAATGVSGSISATQLTGTIAPANIGAGTISSNMLAAGAVTTAALADGAVTAAKVATVSNWFALKIVKPAPAADDHFGWSLAAAGSGSGLVLIGADGDDTGAGNAGAAYLFSTSGALLTTFTNPAPAGNEGFGYSVAAGGSGRVLIGAPYDDTGALNAGAAYLFNTGGTLLTTFTNPTPALNDNFGFSVAAVGSDRVLIGEGNDVTEAEVAYLFNTSGTLLTTFTNPTPALGDRFGWSMAGVGSDRVLIGARADNTGAQGAGAAYLFNTSGTLLTTFTNPTPTAGDLFGVSVAAVGSDGVLIGAYADNAGAVNAGAAYLFSTNGTLLTTFTNPTPAVDDWFGYSVAAVGSGRVLIGAYGAGAAYLFSTNGTLLTTFTNPALSATLFGWSVAAVGSDRVLIGAYVDDTGAVNAGAAYLFSIETYAPGLIADGLSAGSVTTASLEDGAVTVAKLDPTIGVWTRSLNNVVRLAGNVGIGTNSPNERLVVAGNIFATGSITANTFVGDGSALTGIHSLDAADGSPTDAVFVNNVGRVGINLTNPLHRLHVGTTLGTNAFNASPNVIAIEDAVENGRATFLALAGIGGPDTTNRVEVQIEAVESMRRGIIGTTTEHPVHFRVGNSDVMVAATNRFIGINESDPQARLHVTHNGSSAPQIHLEQAFNNDFARLRFTSTTKPHWDLAVGGTSNVMNFYSSGNGNVMTLTTNGNLTTIGTVNGVSDRNAKDHFTPVDSRDILEKVAQLPLARWHYKTDPGVPHLGPVAQDFHAAFGLGADDKHIATVDADGVALAAIQGLNQKLEQKETEIAELTQRLDALEKIIRHQKSN